MKFETRTEEDGKVVLRLGLTHEAGFPVEPNIDVIVTGVQMLVEAVCGISIFDLTRAVIEEYVKNGRPPEGWVDPTPEPEEAANEDTSDGKSGTDEPQESVPSPKRRRRNRDNPRKEPSGG